MNLESIQLRCPQCKEKLRLKGNKLSCSNHEYEVNGNYINFITSLEPETTKTMDAASYRWENVKKIEEDESFIQHQFEDFLSRYGFESLEAFRNYIKGKNRIAEIGAGEGRVIDWLLKYSDAETIFALELSDSAQYLAKKYQNESRVIVIQCDAQQHPFPENCYDILFCEQSIHHCQDPALTFSSLVDSLTKEGNLFLAMYAKKSPIREKFDHLIRDNIASKSNEEKHYISKQITELSKILSEIDVNITIPESYTEFGSMASSTVTLQRLLYYSVFKCFWNNEYTHEKNIEINLDWYSYPSSHKIDLKDILIWFNKAEMNIEHTEIRAANNSFRAVKR